MKLRKKLLLILFIGIIIIPSLIFSIYKLFLYQDKETIVQKQSVQYQNKNDIQIKDQMIIRKKSDINNINKEMIISDKDSKLDLNLIEEKKESIISNQYSTLTVFNHPLPWKEYKSFRIENCISKDGYGIYYDKAEVQMNWEKDENMNKVMKIKYKIPYLKKWGNWFSIVREFDSVKNFENHSGIRLVFKNQSSSSVKIRLTIRDLLSNKRKEQKDEMWWMDNFENYIIDDSEDWITIHAPFNKFYLSKGMGTRQNDKKLNLSRISAYEISLISTSTKETVNGELYLKTIDLYDDLVTRR